jgi:hypothetical protein
MATSNPARPSGPAWRRLKAQVRATRGPCCRCNQRIDYRLEYPHPDSFSVDHYPHPLSTHPWLAMDPANLRPAHLQCNQAGGTRPPAPPLGLPSERW